MYCNLLPILSARSPRIRVWNDGHWLCVYLCTQVSDWLTYYRTVSLCVCLRSWDLGCVGQGRGCMARYSDFGFDLSSDLSWLRLWQTWSWDSGLPERALAHSLPLLAPYLVETNRLNVLLNSLHFPLICLAGWGAEFRPMWSGKIGCRHNILHLLSLSVSFIRDTKNWSYFTVGCVLAEERQRFVVEGSTAQRGCFILEGEPCPL